MERILLCKPKMCGREPNFIIAQLTKDWAMHLGLDCQPNDNVEAMRIALDAAGIESRPLWKPMHRQPVYRSNPAHTNGVSESLFKTGICLPSGPWVTDAHVRYIVDNIKKAIIP